MAKRIMTSKKKSRAVRMVQMNVTVPESVRDEVKNRAAKREINCGEYLTKSLRHVGIK